MFDQVLDNLRKATGSTPQAKLVEAWSEYLVDSVQRAVLFWDVMRKRGDNFLENTGRGGPPVLFFDYDVLIDGRTLDRPCNYALMSIRAPQGVTVDPAKRPVVVVDPRAGHGSGVGGFKLDSEIGFALRAGHPVYFIGFYTEPVPGQTLVDIGEAESRFLEEVIRRHPGAGNKPFVIGNCQAGWAVAALAAVRPELTGPVAFVGAPLSYWAGADSQNPMRYNGGIFGGTWPGNLLADLGGGILDGAWFVQNFENLDPATHALEEALRPLLPGRHRGATLPRLRALVGRVLPDDQAGVPGDRRQPVRRQPVGPGDRAAERAEDRPQEHHVAGGRVRLVGRQHLAAPAGAQLDRRRLRPRGPDRRPGPRDRVLARRGRGAPEHLRRGPRSPGRSTAS